MQPWHVYVLTDTALEEFRAAVRAKLPTQPRGEGTEYDVYPKNLTDPYLARRFKCGEDLYATIDVPREDKAARLKQFARNYELFGAPVGLFFAIESIGRISGGQRKGRAECRVETGRLKEDPSFGAHSPLALSPTSSSPVPMWT